MVSPSISPENAPAGHGTSVIAGATMDNQILFDLFSATCFWLICLFFSMFANFPMANISPEISGIISFGFSICGLLSFFPIGYSLWMILSNIDVPEGDKTTLPKNQDENFWTKPTDLD